MANKVKEWNKQRAKLKKEFIKRGITKCEIKLDGCWHNNGLSFAHRHKRIWYYPEDKKELLGDFNQVLLACPVCHTKIEGNKQLTSDIFHRLRGEEKL